MVICQIITTLVYGGAEKLLVNFSDILADKHEIHIIYLKGDPKLKDSLDPRIKVHYVPLTIFCSGDIRSLIKKLKPDVVHTHLGHADLIGLWACRRLPVKLFCTMHNVYFKWNFVDRIIFYLYYLTFKMHGQRTVVSCISRAVAQHTNTTLGVPIERIRIHYNSIPELPVQQSRNEARHDLLIKSGDFCLLTIGRLRIQKSQETLLRALAILESKIQHIRLFIVGEGEMEEYLKDLANELGISSIVEFRGGTRTPEKFYAASDIFVLPSVFEGLPTVVLEAFRSSIPVIGSNVDGTNDLIENEVNGLLFEPENHTELADKIVMLYQSPEYRAKLGTNGYLSYRAKYDIKNYAHEMEILYSE